ncbi:MAG: malto-oligosyltrehalose synthase [Gammaproteobacteria bacterium]
MKGPMEPCATYRLQFNRDFTFADATAIIPYLHLLGITHVYASPYLKARSGSPHGYDIVDHNSLDPEIGEAAEFSAYVETLHRHQMGQILDIVPNHMGVGGNDNAWWLDILENGEASRYASYFDIDWHPVNPALRNKVLLPFLGDHYGTVLEQGELSLGYDPDSGTFSVHYYEHLFPIDPRTYPQILAHGIDTLEQQSGSDHAVFGELRSLLADLKSLPRRTELSATRRQQRRQGTAACKHRLAALCRSRAEIHAVVRENLTRFNGTAGRPKSFDLLHQLLESQAYRLAYWLVASDEINYRRFFDINELAGIRMESSEVFEATHRLIQQLIATGKINGLRVDHPDGLSDPYGYFCDLQNLIYECSDSPAADTDASCYLLVEKILASHERLPADWPVAGTTGYEAAYLLNGLFVYPGSERQLDRLYSRHIGGGVGFDELLYKSKKLIIRSTLSGELTVLANLLSYIAQSERHTRDFTYQGLRYALGEVAARFPVYRTYITSRRIREEDRRYVHWAIAKAKKHTPAADVAIFDFIHDMLVLARLDEYRANIQRRIIQFALRFQQYTAPVMAKGMEDTAFYVYNRLVSLNDVGFDPRVFGISPNAFHHGNRQRLADWPSAMVTTSTHDSKRGEDVRARINVLSELADQWRVHLGRWNRINRGRKRLVNEELIPSRNDEYLLYQTLIGTWPGELLDAAGLDAFRQRIELYMLKAVKEAKVHTSWIHPDEEYENALCHFVRTLLGDPEHNAFLADFLPFQKHIARFGMLNSLSQTLLKLTVPGVPDIYQGNELWAFNLVDPDNRRSVDYDHRQITLQSLITASGNGDNLTALLQELLNRIEDGRAKLYLTWKALGLRRLHPRIFSNGQYLSLEPQGLKADHICAFARRLEDREVLVAATRWFARLAGDSNRLPLGSPVWDDTWIEGPEGMQARSYRNVLTGETVPTLQYENGYRLKATDLFNCFPVALLTND